MGNDEFILYVRKQNKGCKLYTQKLGKLIANEIKKLDPNTKQLEPIEKCKWGSSGKHVTSDNLPKDAHQFQFNRNILPDLYNFLDSLK
jgi:hypothetical protein